MRKLTHQADPGHRRLPPSGVVGALCAATLVLTGCVYDWPTGRIPDIPGCGNDVIEPPEDCDGRDLAGETCESLGYAGGGTLGCLDNCAMDTSGCISNSVCGDGTMAPDEACDDGDLDDGDGCDGQCGLEPGWTCAGSPSVCEAGCGNGLCYLDGGEDHASCPEDCGWIQVSTLENHTCGLKADGTAWCWGSNDYGQLGDGTTEPRLSPVRVDELTGLVSIAAGERHACAINVAGHGWCWGANERGQLGNGTDVASPIPVPVAGLGGAETLAAGADHTCATTTERLAYCWGRNDEGQLGDGSTTDRTTATLVAEGEGLTSVGHITAGGRHTCAVRNDDTVWCWGKNDQGQLGNATADDSPLPLAVDTSDGFSGASLLSAGGWHTCARDTTGVAWCWGDGADRRLGSGFTQDERSPSLVVGIDPVISIAAGTTHTCAIVTGATGWCWGRGTEGQLGSGTNPNNTEPVVVQDATGLQQITAGSSHTCAIIEDGTVWCWGANDQGQLGDSSTQSSNVPVMVDDPY